MARLVPITDVLAELAARGIEVIVAGTDLRVRAAMGVLRPGDQDTLRARKSEVLAHLAGTSPSATVRPDPPEQFPPTPRAKKPKIRPHSQNSHNSQNSRGTARGRDSANNANSAKRLQVDPERPSGRRPQKVQAGGEWVVTISGTRYPFGIWDGEIMPGEHMAFDTETAEAEPNKIPPLALASASGDDCHRLVHPDRLGQFLISHKDRHFITHNVAFDFWVVVRHLEESGQRKALRIWWGIADDDRLHDTMLLDELIRLAERDEYPNPRDLAVVAREYTDLEIDKDNPYRRRYAEIIGADWCNVDRGFFTYGIKDPIVTAATYKEMRPLAINLMMEHGYDPGRRRR
jgi:hypothetical protein